MYVGEETPRELELVPENITTKLLLLCIIVATKSLTLLFFTPGFL